ncbi:ShlB/FhaC/HecB family hemolysin secretion/activation protein, partial [Acidovorax cavernicola]
MLASLLPSFPRCRQALCTAGWLGLGVLSTPAWAQPVVIPPAGQAGTLQQLQIEEDRRRREQERLRPAAPDPLRRPESPTPPPISPSAGGLRFDVREIRFTPSAILAPADLEAIAAQYRGRQVSLAELQELVLQVNELYKAKGVVTAIATIAPQDISNGVVEVKLVEGRVGEVGISGNATTHTSYIQARLGLVAGEIVDLNELEDSLVWFNRTNDVRLEADLQPGKEFGSTDILINAIEPDRHQLLATLDNLGSPMTGRWRAGMSYRNRSLLGFRDDLSLAYTYASGQKSGSAGYGLPINRWGGRVNYTYYDDATAVRYGALSSLKITGRSESHVLSMRQP